MILDKFEGVLRLVVDVELLQRLLHWLSALWISVATEWR